ncbi:MAG TPA: potassium-transporting ATPase subunit C [Candidatus Dormibacteraeota bacterium]|nr:potassium-transporting ATPase subunit C [Candidatus Dormibacteraeota bacterium]
MLAQLRGAIVLSLIAIVLFGVGYPLAGTAVSQLLFNHQANGSLVKGGSTLVGQSWSSPDWFHGRPDADNPLVANRKPGSSGASNLGPRSEALVQQTRKLIAYWHSQGVNPTTDLVTTSASGYDPDITPADALAQIPMVSRATGISPARLRELIRRETQGPELGFLGPSYIDVLQLNQALAAMR